MSEKGYARPGDGPAEALRTHSNGDGQPGRQLPDRPERFTLPFQIIANAAELAERYGERTPSDVVYAENKMRVLHYTQACSRFPVPLVMTAPLMMPHYVMDLRPGRSLVQYLATRGLDVYMVDWGAPDDTDRFDTLDDYVVRYLKHAIDAVRRLTRQDRVSLHGYCQGGLLAVLFAALYPERVCNLISQTGPVNFHDDGIYSLWTRHLNVDLFVDTLGNLPGQMLSSTLQFINPTGAFAQTIRYFDRLEDEEYVRDYIAMNTWLNHVVDIPGEFFRKFIKDLYQRNLLVKGQLQIAGRCVDLRRITCPLLTLTSKKDHVVPWQSAAVLNDLVSSTDKELVLLEGGHVGMTMGREAWKELWPRFADWTVARSGQEKEAVNA